MAHGTAGCRLRPRTGGVVSCAGVIPRRIRREKHDWNDHSRAEARGGDDSRARARGRRTGDHGCDDGIGCAIARRCAGHRRRRVLHELRLAARRGGLRHRRGGRRRHRRTAAPARSTGRRDREGRRARPQVRPGQPGRPLAGSRSSRRKSITDRQEPEGAEERQAGASTQEAKLLTILVEFDENANDDFTGVVRADRRSARRTASPARCRADRSTTTSRTRPTTTSRTTTRCGCRTSPPSTSTRCCSPTRASRSACAPTSPAPTASPASTSPATR